MRTRGMVRVGVLVGTSLATISISIVPSGAIVSSGLAASSGAASGGRAALVESHAPRLPAPSPGPGPGPVGGQATPVRHSWTARNWSGYAVSGGSYTSVSGTWVVPTVLRPAKKRQVRKAAFSSDWVGIDGFTNSNLIQTGTEEDWTGGRSPSAQYTAWWEILPAPETPIPMTVHPGDVMSATISDVAGPSWMISLTNTSTGQRFSTTAGYAGQLSSAEWIHEAVSVNGRVANLPDDTNVPFDMAAVNGVAVALNGSDAGVMTKGRHVISAPSVPDGDADGFAVAFGASAPPPPPS